LRKRAIHPLGEDHFPVVRADGPLAREQALVWQARAAELAEEPDGITGNDDRDVRGLKPGHGGCQHQAILDLVELDGDGVVM
jgi:hypothetical protein